MLHFANLSKSSLVRTSIVINNADTRITPPIAKAVYEFLSKSRPLALRACLAWRINICPSEAAMNPTTKPTTAKSKSNSPNTKNDVVAARLVNKIIADDVALTTAGCTPMANIIGTVIAVAPLFEYKKQQKQVRTVARTLLQNPYTQEITYYHHQFQVYQRIIRRIQKRPDIAPHSSYPI